MYEIRLDNFEKGNEELCNDMIELGRRVEELTSHEHLVQSLKKRSPSKTIKKKEPTSPLKQISTWYQSQ